MYLPVFIEGANVSTGDMHFSQGDGEIAFCGAIEMSGFLELKYVSFYLSPMIFCVFLLTLLGTSIMILQSYSIYLMQQNMQVHFVINITRYTRTHMYHLLSFIADHVLVNAWSTIILSNITQFWVALR